MKRQGYAFDDSTFKSEMKAEQRCQDRPVKNEQWTGSGTFFVNLDVSLKTVDSQWFLKLIF